LNWRCSLFVLSQDISENPTYEALIKFQEAIQQTNQVLSKLDKQPIFISQDYFTKNFTAIENQKLLGKDSEKIITDVSKLEVKYRKILATNLSTDSALLSRLSSDCSCEVRKLVAQHPNTDIEILEKLAQNKNMDVRMAAKKALYQKI
jgi:hypothetical protein